MKSIMLCNRLGHLQSFLPPPPIPIRALILDENSETRRIRSFLRQRGNTVELPRTDLNRERSNNFRSSYVEALGHLNAEQGNLWWWAMPFTSKNPIATSLCRDTFSFLLIVDLMKKEEGLLVVITDSEPLARQVLVWGQTTEVFVAKYVKPNLGLRERVIRYQFLALAFRVFRTIWFKLCVGIRRLERVSRPKKDAIIFTVIEKNSINQEGQFFDTYFGNLSVWLRNHNISLCIAGLVGRLSVSRARAFHQADKENILISIDAVPRLWDILLSAWEAIKSHQQVGCHKHTMSITGINIDYLLHSAKEEAHLSGNVFFNFCLYRAIQRLTSKVQIATCLYPYENRAWEKMLILGVRSVSPSVKIVGYQHASITPSHLNLILTEKEVHATPLPDLILTTGQVPERWLIHEGHHPPHMLKVSCALRQPTIGILGCRPRRLGKPLRILVALASSLSEYISVLIFLKEAIKTPECWEICIRPHVTIRLEEVEDLMPNGWSRFKYSISNTELSKDLEWADAVLYASSTVGLEAVGRGVPSVYLDLGDIFETDPMSGWTDFKWTAKVPADLGKIFYKINFLPNDKYEALQRKGLKYAEAYLRPVKEHRLSIFSDSLRMNMNETFKA